MPRPPGLVGQDENWRQLEIRWVDPKTRKIEWASRIRVKNSHRPFYQRGICRATDLQAKRGRDAHVSLRPEAGKEGHLLRASDLGYSPWAVVMVYALYNLTYSALSYPAGALSDRLGRWRIIAVGWMIYAGVYAGFALLPASHSWGLWPLMAVYGVYMALTDGVGKALIADHAPREHRGAAMGIFYALTGLTTLGASLLAGIVWDRSGPTAAFLIGAGFAVVALVALGTLRAVQSR